MPGAAGGIGGKWENRNKQAHGNTEQQIPDAGASIDPLRSAVFRRRWLPVGRSRLHFQILAKRGGRVKQKLNASKKFTKLQPIGFDLAAED
jgi:hypothetical protein